jgi:hypothetical protein
LLSSHVSRVFAKDEKGWLYEVCTTDVIPLKIHVALRIPNCKCAYSKSGWTSHFRPFEMLTGFAFVSLKVANGREVIRFVD